MGGGDVATSHNLIEERLVVDILREVLTPLHPAHRVAPSLEEGERAFSAAEAEHARVELVRSRAAQIVRDRELVRAHQDVGACDEGRLGQRRLLRVGPAHPALPVTVEPHHVQVGDEHLVRVRVGVKGLGLVRVSEG